MISNQSNNWDYFLNSAQLSQWPTFRNSDVERIGSRSMRRRPPAGLRLQHSATVWLMCVWNHPSWRHLHRSHSSWRHLCWRHLGWRQGRPRLKHMRHSRWSCDEIFIHHWRNAQRSRIPSSYWFPRISSSWFVHCYHPMSSFIVPCQSSCRSDL